MDEVPLSNEEAIAQAQAEKKWQVKKQIRAAIKQNAGDDRSLLGTTADAGALCLFELGTLARGLSGANSLAEMRAAAKPFADLMGPLLDAVARGDLVLPYTVKGVNTVMGVISRRSNAVSDVLKAAKQGADTGSVGG